METRNQEEKIRYTAKYFRDNLPEWKKKKDSLIGRLLYRRLSFYISAFFSNRGLGANAISYFSIFIAITACGLYLFHNYYLALLGAVLMNIWALLDDADGNMARSVKKEPFGEFADAISSYVLVAFMCTSFAMYAYFCGGQIIRDGNIWIVFIGAIASTSDTLMRLIYQKYKSNEYELADQKVLTIENDYRLDHSKVGSIKSRIEAEFGLSETMTVVILLCTVFKALDLLVIYYCLYFCGSLVVSSCIFINKAIRFTNSHLDIDLNNYNSTGEKK